MTPRGAATAPARRQWILLAVVFVLSLPAVTPRLYSSDEIQYFSYLRSMWFDRDLDFENEYQYFYDRGIARSEGFHETFLERATPTGRRINFATLGCAVLWAPFYAVGDLVARAGAGPADGFSKPYIAAVAYGSAVYAFLALVLAIHSARLLGLDAFIAAFVIWLGTPLLFYAYIAPPYSHACSAFAVSLFIHVWLRVRDRWTARGLVALGATGALMAMVREQDIFFAAGPALDFLWSSWQPEAASWKPEAGSREREAGSRKPEAGSRKPEAGSRKLAAVLAAAAAFAVVYTPQALAYLRLNGHVGPHSSVGAKMNWVSPHALQVLFSPEHGFFIWTPLALLALGGLLSGAFARTDGALPPKGGSYLPNTPKNRVFICLLLMIAFQVYVSGAVESWTVAGAFGQRRFVALTAILVIGYAALWQAARSSGARLALGIVTVVCVYWNLALMAEFATGLMNRQKLEPGRNAYDAFVTIPVQAPSLAYRYLFDRASFYKGPQ